MTKKIISLILAAIICFNFASCSKMEDVENKVFPTSWHLQQLENEEPFFSAGKDNSFSVGCYRKMISDFKFLHDCTPESFYTIICKVNLRKSRFEHSSKPAVILYTDRSFDFNGEIVVSDLSYGEYEEINKEFVEIRRTVKSDSDGKIGFELKIGTEDNAMSGEVFVDSVQVIPAESDDRYLVAKSEDGTIRMVIDADDFNKADITYAELVAWLNMCSEIRKDIKCLVGDIEPYNGRSDYILTEEFKYYGLSGDPIYINKNFVSDEFVQLSFGKDESSMFNVLWKYVHELSHSFDGIEGSNIEKKWNFDSEFFANLKMACVFDKNEYTINGKNIRSFFSDRDTLKNGVYSSDGFLYKFLIALEGYDLWAVLNDVFSHINSINTIPTTDNERFALFWNTLNNTMGFNVEELFFEEEWNTVAVKYQYKN